MGWADSTTNVFNSGLHISNDYQNKNSKPLVEDMTEEYGEEDNIRVLLTYYSKWLATTDIPKYFDEDLQSNRIPKFNTSKTKNYLSKVIIMLKDKFPNHCAWE